MNIVLQEIKKAIDKRLEWKPCKHFYIGKTGNFNNRRYELANEGYNLCWELAYGTSKQISKLENDLIGIYIEDKRLCNQNQGSGCNPNATSLYVAFYFENLQENELDDDIMPISPKFPLEIK